MRLNQNELSQAVRLALTLGVTATAAATSGVVFAQETKSGETKKLETMTVLGSRIKRVDVETAQPVAVIDKAEIQRTGLANVGDVLTSLVYSDNSGVTTVNNLTNGNNGTVNVSLRNFGPQRTLVLVNGRRWVANFGVVDFQTIPLAIVERIEILKDGASAIYGSDAIAGVINLVTKKSYDGMEVNSYVGENDHGDGRQESYDFSLGGSTDRASLMVNFAYTKQEEIFAGDRRISSEPLYLGGPGYGSASNLYGRFSASGAPTLTNRVLNTGAAGTRPEDFHAFSNADRYNFAPVNYLQQPFDRYSMYLQGRYDITDNITFFTNATYVKRRGSQQLAEVPLTIAASGTQGPQWQFAVSSANVFNPFGRDITTANFRMQALGPRHNNFDFDTYAFTGGFEGSFDLWDRNFTWDTAFQYHANNYDSSGDNYVNLFNLRNALGPSFRDSAGVLRCGAPGAVINGCVPFNLFGGPDLGVAAGRQSAAEARAGLNYVGYQLVNTQENTLADYTANITGEILELPAGPLGFATGFEYRRDNGVFTPDALVSEGGSSTNFTERTSGVEVVNEYYVEFNAPIVKDMTGIQSLELSLAARYSDYSAHGYFRRPTELVPHDQAARFLGNTTNWKAGFKWKPINDLLVRGNYAKTFRAPNVSDLFAGQAEGFPAATDPCRTSNWNNLTVGQQQRCVAAGVPGTPGTPGGGAPQANSQIRALFGGNIDLKPEQGHTGTLGLVYSPSYVEGLDVGLDWYRIRLKDGLTSFGANTTLARCIRGTDADRIRFCPLISRNPASGEVAAVNTTQFNAAALIEEGYDLTSSYKFDTQWGKFRINNALAYTTHSQFQPEKGADFDDATGEQAGTATWRIRDQFSVNWQMGDWDATWGVRYFSGLEEDCSPNLINADDAEYCNRIVDSGPDGSNGDGIFNDIPTITYNDFQVGWNSPWDGRITAGLRNAFNKQPPPSATTFANGFPNSYDIPGRFWYVSYHQKF